MSKDKLKRLIEEVYGRKESQEDVEGCKKVCKTGIKLRRNPEKPMVGLPIGEVFKKSNKSRYRGARKEKIHSAGGLSHTILPG